jgi:hypothetical protein
LRADAYEATGEHERALADRKKAKELDPIIKPRPPLS